MLQVWGFWSKKKTKSGSKKKTKSGSEEKKNENEVQDNRRLSIVKATVKLKTKGVKVRSCDDDEEHISDKIACLERNLGDLPDNENVREKRTKLIQKIKEVYKSIENTPDGFFYFLYQHSDKDTVQHNPYITQGKLRNDDKFSYYKGKKTIESTYSMPLLVNITQDANKNYNIEFFIFKGNGTRSEESYFKEIEETETNKELLEHAWMAKMTAEKEDKGYKYTVAYAFDDKHHLCYRCTKGIGTRSFHLTSDGEFICGDKRLKITEYKKNDDLNHSYLTSWTITVKGDVSCLWVRLKF